MSSFLIWKPWIWALAPCGPTPALPHVILFMTEIKQIGIRNQYPHSAEAGIADTIERLLRAGELEPCQDVFPFTYKNQQLRDTRLPQDFALSLGQVLKSSSQTAAPGLPVAG
ncbi:hypothetical protein GOODEAATRI_028831 [Goodea atripinnis]|uniref:Uncharacterized protein n=1 Tax=Goodea atripinnis TaxID=208336 RepID=A0ABV0NP02_9TELE